MRYTTVYIWLNRVSLLFVDTFNSSCNGFTEHYWRRVFSQCICFPYSSIPIRHTKTTKSLRNWDATCTQNLYGVYLLSVLAVPNLTHGVPNSEIIEHLLMISTLYFLYLLPKVAVLNLTYGKANETPEHIPRISTVYLLSIVSAPDLTHGAAKETQEN